MFRFQWRPKEDTVPKRLPKGFAGGVHEEVHQVTFSTLCELWAVLGTKCLQELSQESPEPSQASFFHSAMTVSENHRKSIKIYPKCFQNHASIPFLCLKCWGSVISARWRASRRQVDFMQKYFKHTRTSQLIFKTYYFWKSENLKS